MQAFEKGEEAVVSEESGSCLCSQPLQSRAAQRNRAQHLHHKALLLFIRPLG
jgi:hypothetical protein